MSSTLYIFLHPECKADGDFLLHPTNRCKYIRCTYGPEPWKDEYGNYKFYGVERDCPYGTAVSRSFYNHEAYGYNSYNGAQHVESRLCSDRVTSGYGHISNYDQCSGKRQLPIFRLLLGYGLL